MSGGRLLTVTLLAVALLLPAQSPADTILRDRQGRPMRFEVLAPGVDVAWYANLLRRAAHGDEISDVTIRIVPREQVSRRCGRTATGCYRGGSTATITVPAGADSQTAYTLIHEYAHHLDHAIDVDDVREPNGTPAWWRARDMEGLLAEGRVARDYSLGWSRSIGEIFAEDYAQLHLRLPYRIGWLDPPGPAVRAALRRDLDNVPASPFNPPPLVITRAGVLAPGQARAVPFGLLGPGRHVTFTASVGGATAAGTRGRLELVCSNGRSFRAELGQNRRSATIDRRNLGPASCRAVLENTGAAARRFTLRIRLAIE